MRQENENVPQEFYEVADEFILLANNLAERWSLSGISSAILYAAARYNAFNFYALESDIENNKEKAIEYYCEQYKKMLLSNLDNLAKDQSKDE